MPPSRRLLLSLPLAALTACAGGKWTTTTTVGSETKVRGDEESMKQHAAQQQAARDREAAIAAAPRRAPTDPIEVVLLEATVSEDLKKSLDAEAAQAALLKALQADPLLKVTVVKGLKDKYGRQPYGLADSMRASAERGYTGDVYVLPHILLEDAIGRSGGGKLASVKAFTVNTEIATHYDSRKAEPKARGPLLQNLKVIDEAGAAIRRAVVSDLGPALPSRAAIAEYDQQQMKKLHERVGIKPEDDGVTRLRKLLGAKPEKDVATPPTTAAPAP